MARYTSPKNYTKVYQVWLYDSSDYRNQFEGVFATKAEATAYIQSRLDQDPTLWVADFTMFVPIQFTVNIGEPA